MKTFKFGESKVYLHQDDLPKNIQTPEVISIDTETTGLSLKRDRLCLIQFAFSKEECHMVQFNKNELGKQNKHEEILKILSNKKIQKIFHYARFDAAVIKKTFKVDVENIFCTKISSKLVRTYTDKHGLKELCRELLGIELNKSQQSSDWSLNNLSDQQIKYASYDVIYLFELKKILEHMLEREERMEIAKSLFLFLPVRIKLDLLDFIDSDIFSH